MLIELKTLNFINYTSLKVKTLQILVFLLKTFHCFEATKSEIYEQIYKKLSKNSQQQQNSSILNPTSSLFSVFPYSPLPPSPES